jgi:hypothetical protein
MSFASIVRLASSLPKGSSERRKLLILAKESKKVKVENKDGKIVYVTENTLKGPEGKNYKKIDDTKDTKDTKDTSSKTTPRSKTSIP